MLTQPDVCRTRTIRKNGETAKKVKRTYDFLARVFPEKTPELERYNVINLYCLGFDAHRRIRLEGLNHPAGAMFIQFEMDRRKKRMIFPLRIEIWDLQSIVAD